MNSFLKGNKEGLKNFPENLPSANILGKKHSIRKVERESV